MPLSTAGNEVSHAHRHEDSGALSLLQGKGCLGLLCAGVGAYGSCKSGQRTWNIPLGEQTAISVSMAEGLAPLVCLSRGKLRKYI